MEVIIHRINELKKLKEIKEIYGVEIDIRSYKSKLILNHEPHLKGDTLENFLENYKHGTLVLNIKESGIENEVLLLVKKYNINSYFLLDVEFPFIYLAFTKKIKSLALRFSEYESVENIKIFENSFNWVWIDTINRNPISKNNYKFLKKFKTCLVSPDRWGRPKDIISMKKNLEKNNFKIDAVMTELKYANLWD
jgi:hypothetical protein